MTQSSPVSTLIVVMVYARRYYSFYLTSAQDVPSRSRSPKSNRSPKWSPKSQTLSLFRFSEWIQRVKYYRRFRKRKRELGRLATGQCCAKSTHTLLTLEKRNWPVKLWGCVPAIRHIQKERFMNMQRRLERSCATESIVLVCAKWPLHAGVSIQFV